MRHIVLVGFAMSTALAQAACGTTTAQHPDPRVPGSAAAGCERVAYQTQSAERHGQAPANDAQNAHGGTVKVLHQASDSEYASVNSCSGYVWQTVR